MPRMVRCGLIQASNALSPSQPLAKIKKAMIEKHLKLNRCSNVDLIQCAAGEDSGDADLYRLDGRNDWYNSLRFLTASEPVTMSPFAASTIFLPASKSLRLISSN